MNVPTLRDLPPPPPGKTGWPWTRGGPVPAAPDDGAWPRLTVVIPSYNQAAFVEEALRSILLQGYPDLELIVMDGGSRDGTGEILQKYAPWIAHQESGPDGGQTRAINKGFARATGQILTWINSDDFLVAGALAKLASHPAAWDALRSGRPALAVGCGYFCDETGRPGMVFGAPDGSRFADEVRFHCTILQPTAFFNRPLWEQAGPLDAGFSWCFDWDFWIRSTQRGAAVHGFPDFVAGAYQHGEQKTRTGAEARGAEMRAMLARNAAAAGDRDLASLAGAVHGLWRGIFRFCGYQPVLRQYARHAAAGLLHLRFRRFSRARIRDLLAQFGI